MEATTVIQQIEQLLLSAQQPEGHQEGQPSGQNRNFREIAGKLSTLISDPRIYRYENLRMLPRGLEEESIIIFDALESVTNGMYDPEILNRLRSIEDDSAFTPWKYTILALLSFYQADRDNMLQLVGRIPQDTPPALIGEVLLRLTGIRSPDEADKQVVKLIDLVREDHTFMKSAVRQLEEYLNEDFEEAFVENSILLIRELLSSHPETARRLALWSMRIAADRDYDLSAYPSRLSELFGKNEGMRLTAIALAETDPDLSILFWLRYAVSRPIERRTEEVETSAILSILADIWTSLGREDFFTQLQNNKTYTKSLLSLLRKLQDELLQAGNGEGFPEALFSEKSDPFSLMEIVRSIYGELENRTDKNAGQDSPSAGRDFLHAEQGFLPAGQDILPAGRVWKHCGKKPEQLELFDT